MKRRIPIILIMVPYISAIWPSNLVSKNIEQLKSRQQLKKQEEGGNTQETVMLVHTSTAWKVSRYGAFFWSVFSRKHGPEKTPYFDTFHSVHNSKYNEITTNVYSITLQLYEYPIFLCIYCPWFFDLKYRYHFQYSDFQKTITIVSPAAIGCYFVTIICYGFACMFV